MAIEVKSDEGNDSKISINPRGTKLPSNTVGFFIAQSAEEVKRYFDIYVMGNWILPKSYNVYNNFLVDLNIFYSEVVKEKTCKSSIFYFFPELGITVKPVTKISKMKI